MGELLSMMNSKDFFHFGVKAFGFPAAQFFMSCHSLLYTGINSVFEEAKILTKYFLAPLVFWPYDNQLCPEELS